MKAKPVDAGYVISLYIKERKLHQDGIVVDRWNAQTLYSHKNSVMKRHLSKNEGGKTRRVEVLLNHGIICVNVDDAPFTTCVFWLCLNSEGIFPHRT